MSPGGKALGSTWGPSASTPGRRWRRCSRPWATETARAPAGPSPIPPARRSRRSAPTPRSGRRSSTSPRTCRCSGWPSSRPGRWVSAGATSCARRSSSLTSRIRSGRSRPSGRPPPSATSATSRPPSPTATRSAWTTRRCSSPCSSSWRTRPRSPASPATTASAAQCSRTSSASAGSCTTPSWSPPAASAPSAASVPRPRRTRPLASPRARRSTSGWTGTRCSSPATAAPRGP
mmetsp:Transcript_16095/g.50580  ORF Transcript_16095/g.50580 Transcript_16095/m.50580 type:complete len:233 (-) Transcript_16095:96-794(-)